MDLYDPKTGRFDPTPLEDFSRKIDSLLGKAKED